MESTFIGKRVGKAVLVNLCEPVSLSTGHTAAPLLHLLPPAPSGDVLGEQPFCHFRPSLQFSSAQRKLPQLGFIMRVTLLHLANHCPPICSQSWLLLCPLVHPGTFRWTRAGAMHSAVGGNIWGSWLIHLDLAGNSVNLSEFMVAGAPFFPNIFSFLIKSWYVTNLHLSPPPLYVFLPNHVRVVTTVEGTLLHGSLQPTWPCPFARKCSLFLLRFPYSALDYTGTLT